MSVIEEIAAERKRQVEVEGWTAEHDGRHHPSGELARAAALYASHAGERFAWSPAEYQAWTPDPDADETPWPWDIEWWKPKNPRRDLIRAAALIVAEIDRLDRERREGE